MRKITFSCIFLLFFSLGVNASEKVSHLLIKKIALEERIPVKLLKSVIYIESGFHPWTLNVRGQPYFFATRKAAEQFLETVIKKGVTNIDIGCGQINWHFHRKNFQHPQELLSPEICLRYAARLLRQHSVKTRSWVKAALLYHSGDKMRQGVYRKRLINYLTHGRAA